MDELRNYFKIPVATIESELAELFSNLLRDKYDIKIIPELSWTNESSKGDLSTNIALIVAKKLGRNPKELAVEIINFISDSDRFEKIESAGPGFINIFLSRSFIIEKVLVKKYLLEKNPSIDKEIMVEFGQPNTHKALTVGHLKSAITGLCISNLVEYLGYKIIRANYYGDVGLHVAKCIWGFEKKAKPENYDKLNTNEKMAFIADCYVYGNAEYKDNPEATTEIKAINKSVYLKDDAHINKIYEELRLLSREHQKDFFSKLGVRYAREYPESEIAEDAVNIVNNNIDKVFKEDQCAIIFEGKNYNLSNWVFVTSEGNPTYSAKDLGLAFKKKEEYPNLVKSITLTSTEQNEYFKGVFKALELIDQSMSEVFHHIGFGWLLFNNKKASSRLGNAPKAVEILADAKSESKNKISSEKEYQDDKLDMIAEKVSIAGLKFHILSREIHKDINYDPDEFLNPEGFSGAYVLYAYVRAKSILRSTDVNFNGFDASLVTENDLVILKLLLRSRSVLVMSSENLAPHNICNYLYDLSKSFNRYYHENKVLSEDPELTKLRLAIVNKFAEVLKQGFEILGIETIEQM